MSRPVIWIARRLSDATLARALNATMTLSSIMTTFPITVMISLR